MTRAALHFMARAVRALMMSDPNDFAEEDRCVGGTPIVRKIDPMRSRSCPMRFSGVRMDRVMTVWSAMEEQKSLTCVFVGCGVRCTVV